jgi:hypothetical protein
LVVAVQKGTSASRTVVLERWDKLEPTLVVFRVPPGKYWDAERIQSVETELDGIILETPEVGATLYYWHRGRFKKLIVSE